MLELSGSTGGASRSSVVVEVRAVEVRAVEVRAVVVGEVRAVEVRAVEVRASRAASLGKIPKD